MKLLNIQKGLTILLKYFDYPNTETATVECHTNVLYVDVTDRRISDSDIKELFDLGWNQNWVDIDGKQVYNPNIAWQIRP